MAELKSCFEKMGFKNVATLLQSGNVVFESDLKEEELKKKIEDTLGKTFNYPAKVWVKSIENIQKIVEDNPFIGASKNIISMLFSLRTVWKKTLPKSRVTLTTKQ
jgi:uncharacterized protein (DUF1697 family)